MNNAGVGARTTLETADMATFDRVFALDVRGVYNLTRLLVPELIKTKGNIVNISSISATMVALGSLPFGMAKVKIFLIFRVPYLKRRKRNLIIFPFILFAGPLN